MCGFMEKTLSSKNSNVRDNKGNLKREYIERLSNVLSNSRKLINPEVTDAGHITQILKLPGTSDTVSEAKRDVLMHNPNATKEHVELALKEGDSNVVYAATLCPKATDEQIKRGIKLIVGSGLYESVEDLEKELIHYLPKWRTTNLIHSTAMGRLLKHLRELESDEPKEENLEERASKRLTN